MTHPYVYIIDSPTPNDVVDGLTLGEAIRASLTALAPSCGYQRVFSEGDLRETLSIAHPGTYLAQEYARTRKHPILLFCMHGTNEGLLLANGDGISWRHLAELLQPLNNALPEGVVACFASCKGAFASQMAWYGDLGQPFLWVVGSDLDVPRNDVAIGYLALFHNWPRRSIEECVEVMRVVSGHQGFRYFPGSEVREGFRIMLANEVRWQAALKRVLVPPLVAE